MIELLVKLHDCILLKTVYILCHVAPQADFFFAQLIACLMQLLYRESRILFKRDICVHVIGSGSSNSSHYGEEQYNRAYNQTCCAL